MQKINSKIVFQLRDFSKQLKAKTWENHSIVIYAATTPYPHYNWSPLQLKTGLGGSEIAVIQLTQAWVKLGYQVTVYNSCEEENCYEGVQYFHYSKFNRHDQFNILIVWRYPWILHLKTQAKQIWLDLHEILLPQQVTPNQLKKYHKIFVKSQYHCRILPDIDHSKIAVIPNGVESKFIQLENNRKDPYKLIYASNYTRGLEQMLTYGWPIIQREIPQATLHIYYGFGSITSQNTEDDSIIGSIAWVEKMKQLMTQPGIIEHGRIGVEELLKEKSTASLHYYGCTFQETDCISVRESALVGCIPVTTAYAALAEKNYCIRIDGNPYQLETQEKIAWKIVELLKNPEQLTAFRQTFPAHARQETWENIAQAWLTHL